MMCSLRVILISIEKCLVRRLYQATRYFGVFICVFGAQVVSGYKILRGIHLCFGCADCIRLQDTLGYSFVFLVRRLYQATRYFGVFICVLGAQIVSGYKILWGIHLCFGCAVCTCI